MAGGAEHAESIEGCSGLFCGPEFRNRQHRRQWKDWLLPDAFPEGGPVACLAWRNLFKLFF